MYNGTFICYNMSKMTPEIDRTPLYHELLRELGSPSQASGDDSPTHTDEGSKFAVGDAGVEHSPLVEPDNVVPVNTLGKDGNLPSDAPRQPTAGRSARPRSRSAIPEGYNSVVETTWGVAIGQNDRGELIVAKRDRGGRPTTYKPSRLGELVLNVAISIAPDSISFKALRSRIVETYDVPINTAQLHAALDGLEGFLGNRGGRWLDFGEGDERTISLSGVIGAERTRRSKTPRQPKK